MKNTFILLVAILLFVNVFSVSFANETENEEGLYLTTIEAVSAVGYVDPIFDIEGTIRHHGGDFKYPHSIETHPISVSEASEIVYDISEYDYTHFAAYLGKNAVLEAQGAHVVFVVWADGETIFESEPVAVGEEPVACVAKIPEGTKELKLEVNGGTDGVDYDTSTWGSPMLTNLTVNEIKEQRRVSKTEYKIGDEFAINGGFYTVVYSNGMEVVSMLEDSMVSGFDSETAGTKTITVTFEEQSYTFEVTVVEDATPEPTDKQDESPAPTTAPKKDDNGLVFVVVGAVVLVVVIVLVIAFVLIKRKK